MNEVQESKHINYIERLLKKDIASLINFCKRWNRVNGNNFNVKQPEDFIFELIEKIYEGKRKCNLDTYESFRQSVYYHLKNEMLTHFGFTSKKKILDEYNYQENYNSSLKEIIPYDEEDISCNNSYKNFLTEIENNNTAENIYKLFNEETEAEEILVLQGILEDKKRNTIAEDLGLSVNDVTNIQKRIQRKLPRRIKKLKLEEIQNVK